MKWGGGYIQECFFVRKSVFRDCGNFDLQWPVCADFDFLLRILSAKKRIMSLDTVILQRQKHPGENTMKFYSRMIFEKVSLTRRNGHPLLALRLLIGGMGMSLLQKMLPPEIINSINHFLFRRFIRSGGKGQV